MRADCLPNGVNIMSDRESNTTATLDERVLGFIVKEYQKVFDYQTSDGTTRKHTHTTLTALHHMGGGATDEEIWASLSRLVVAGKIKSTGSHRHKTYAPTKEAV
jgi:hypothetical protein